MRAGTKRRIRILGWMLFICYLILLLYFLFFSEWYGRKNWADADYRYNLHLFKEIMRFWRYRSQLGMRVVLLNLVGNVVGFVPLGFMPPLFSHKCRHVWATVPIGFLMSLSVETMQLFGKVGCFDVDDLFLNTLGTLAGYTAFMLCNRIRRWIFEETI